MGIRKLFVATVLTGATVAFGASAAFAGTEPVVARGEVKVVPGKAVAGQNVTVWLGCPTDVKVASEALTVGRPRPASNQEDELRQVASATVKKDIKPGTYTVTMTCGGDQKATTKFTVVGSAPGTQVKVKPAGAPETGGGATAG